MLIKNITKDSQILSNIIIPSLIVIGSAFPIANAAIPLNEIKTLTCKCKCSVIRTDGLERLETQSIHMPRGGCSEIHGASCKDEFVNPGKIKKDSCSKDVSIISEILKVKPLLNSNEIFVDPK